MKIFRLLAKGWQYIFLLVLALTPILWFINKEGYLINGVDTNFPLDPGVWFQRRFYVWNSVSNAGSDFSSSTAGIFFHLIQVIPFKLGLTLQLVEIMSLVFWFSLISISSFIFARLIFPKKFFAQLIFLIFYVFNIYVFNTWENVKVTNLSLMAGIPLALSMLFLMFNKKISYKVAIFYSAITGLVISGTGINPSYFVCFFLITFIFLLGELLSRGRSVSVWEKIRGYIFVSVIIILVNLFWIIPSIHYIFGNISATESINNIGFNNWIDSLSVNTSLLNVIRLQGAWDWYSFDQVTGLPLYIPYALNYFYRLPFLIFSFLIPSLAIISFLFWNKSKRGLYISSLILLILGIFLTAGTHAPTGNLFKWFYSHIPFLTLFRSPWYIFTPMLVLAYAILISLLFSNLHNRLEELNKIYIRVGFYVATFILIIGNLLYCYPLVTGKIFRPDRNDSFYVKFPQYVFDAVKWLSTQKNDRVISYPDDEIERFKWGYSGVDSILSLAVNSEMVFSPLNASGSPMGVIIKEFYEALKKGQMETVRSLAQKLNVGSIFEKLDQDSISLPLPDIINNLPTKIFGKWKFYELSGREENSKIFLADSNYLASGSSLNAPSLSVLENRDILLNGNDSIVKRLINPSTSGKIIQAKNSQEEDYLGFVESPALLSSKLKLKDVFKVKYIFNIDSERKYSFILENYGLSGFSIFPEKGLTIDLDGKNYVLILQRVTDSYYYFSPITLKPGTHVVTLDILSNNLVQDYVGKGEGIFKIQKDDQGDYLNVINKNSKDIYAEYTVSDFDPLSVYLVQLKYKHIYGNTALILADQKAGSTVMKTQSERLPNYPDWVEYSFYYEPVKTQSALQIYLVSPSTSDPLGTTVDYRDLSVFKIFSNNLFLRSQSTTGMGTADVKYDKVSPVSYRGQLGGFDKPQILVFLENYSPSWQIKFFNSKGEELHLNPKHFSVNLYANAWYIDLPQESVNFKIYYTPQNLFIIGLSLSSIVLAVTTVLYLSARKQRNANK